MDEDRLEERSLTVKLTTEEQLQRGNELAAKIEEMQNIEMSAEEARGNFKAELKRVEGEISRLKRTVLDGKEQRTVRCEWQLNFDHGIAELIRLDTFEVVQSRPLTDEERQGGLFTSAAGA